MRASCPDSTLVTARLPTWRPSCRTSSADRAGDAAAAFCSEAIVEFCCVEEAGALGETPRFSRLASVFLDLDNRR
jgi:hypothetical protein